MASNLNSTNGVILPTFSIAGAELISAKGSMAICDAISALDVLGTLLDAHANGNQPLQDGQAYGLGCILKLIAGNLSEHGYGEMMPLCSDNIQPFLDGEQAARGADNG